MCYRGLVPAKDDVQVFVRLATDDLVARAAATEILGPAVDRLATLHTNARSESPSTQGNS